VSRQLVLRLQWSAGQFSDSPKHHEHDASAVFKYASHNGIDVVAGSEAQVSGRNNLLAALRAAAPGHGYRIVTRQRQDCWIAVSRNLGRLTHAAFDPVVEQVHKPARLGGHGPRGIFRASITPHDGRYGLIRVGVSHWLTKAADPGQHGNALLDRSIGVWAKRAGGGNALAFYMGDTNHNDRAVDVFAGAPLTTCWDELGKWPTTEPSRPGGRGPTLDVIASYDRDKRVRCASAKALTDTDLQLFSDHYTIRATYAIEPRGGA
jgi:hypothetical protein